MKTIKPTSVSVVLNYQCPECSKSYPIELIQAKIQGFQIKCCGKHMLQPVNKVDTKVVFDRLKLDTEKSIVKAAYHILKMYGHTKQDIDSFVTQKAYDCTQTLVRDFLADK